MMMMMMRQAKIAAGLGHLIDGLMIQATILKVINETFTIVIYFYYHYDDHHHYWQRRGQQKHGHHYHHHE